MQDAQIEPAVESIGERGQVAGRIFSEVDCMVLTFLFVMSTSA